jgi:hypothetical protein
LGGQTSRYWGVSKNRSGGVSSGGICTWRRFRKCLKCLQFPEEYETKLQQLKELLLLENQVFIKVYFADESGFSLTPDIPYGW